jgi:hypothetical protein
MWPMWSPGATSSSRPALRPADPLGHSEGALIASLAAEQAGASAVITLAGSGRPMADVLREQLAQRLPPAQLAGGSALLDRLQAGQTSLVPAPLRQVFRPSVQPYLISLFRQDPAAAFARLPMPALIVQGATTCRWTWPTPNGSRRPSRTRNWC